MNTELQHAKKIASTYNKEFLLVQRKFITANYPIMFIERVIIVFKQKDSNVDMKEYIIPPYLFEVQKLVILFEILL